MRYLALLLAAGALLAGFTATKILHATPAKRVATARGLVYVDTSRWNWPDSLDAVKAAPASHKIIYENDSVRILYVTINPGATEPIHTHKWRSVAWCAHSAPFTLYQYDLDKNHKLVIVDSFTTSKLPLNKKNVWAPESPHAIKNLGRDTLVLYRCEFKQ